MSLLKLKKILYILIFVYAWNYSHSQNLVDNGGFEEYSKLPDGPAQHNYCRAWNDCFGIGTPDYFHLNGTEGANLPFSYVSYLFPHSGSAIMGISLYDHTSILNFREYISSELIFPLVIGINYKLTFYVSNGNAPFYFGGYSCDNFSVAFSTSQLKQTMSHDSFLLKFKPQFVYKNQLFNNGWQLVTYYFVADSAYKYITLGSFVDDNTQKVKPIIPIDSLPHYSGAYYFIDDINLQISSGIDESDNTENSIHVFPNPFNDKIKIECNDIDDYEIIIYDNDSKIAIQQKFSNSVELSTIHIANGTYLYQIKKKNAIIKQGKLIKFFE